MKRVFTSFILLVAVIISMNAQSPFAGGDGTEANPYQIANATHLDNVRQYMDKCFVLTNDIDLKASGYPTWTPIGKVATTSANNSFTAFSGVFDGQGHTISNIDITYSGNYVGFFAVVSGTIKNLAVTGTVNQPSGASAALLAGYLGQTGAPGTIENCSAVGTVTNSGMQAALLVGVATIDNGVIKNCYVGGSVTSNGTGYYGGIIGRTTRPAVQITNCYSTADIKGTNYVGGIIGYFSGAGYVSNLYATGNIEGAQYVGGIAGKLWDNASTTALVALNKSIKGTADVGRVFGVLGTNATLDNCWGLKGMPITVSDATYTPTSDATLKDGGDVTEADNALSSSPNFYANTLSWNFDTDWKMPADGGYPILKSFYIRTADGVALVGGDITTGNVEQINAADAMFIDLTAVTSVSNSVEIKPLHKNALIAVTGTHNGSNVADTKYAILEGTRNMVIQDVNLYPVSALQITDEPTEPQWMGQRSTNPEVKWVSTDNVGYQITRSIPANSFVTTYTTAALSAASLPAGLTAWKAAGYDGTTITFNKVDQLDAFYPYVLFNSNTVATEFSYTGTGDFNLSDWSTSKVAALSVGEAQFQGNFANLKTDGNQWILQNNVGTGSANESVIFKQANGATITAFRAYFTGLKAGAAAKFNSFDTTTGIRQINQQTIINSKVYSINGTEVAAAHLQKGVYIVNGKKFIIK